MQNFQQLGKEFEIFLREILHNFTPYSLEFKQAIEYSLLDGGKRLRPLFQLTIWAAIGKEIKEILPFAAAIEFIHCYSLIHDDLPCMDNDDYRRGKLSNHKKFGEKNALLAGNALLNESFTIIINYALQSSIPKQLILKALSCITKSSTEILCGQYLDMNIPAFSNKNEAYNYLQKMESLKTASLFQSCFEVPTILADLEQKQKEILKEIGFIVGTCYQIKDDLHDQTEGDKKMDYVTLLGEKKSIKILKEKQMNIEEKVKKLNFPTKNLLNLIYLAIN